MRKVPVKKIEEAIKRLCVESNTALGEDVRGALRKAFRQERSPQGKSLIQDLIKNFDIAEKSKMPICQDTGVAVIFLKIGRDVNITGGNLIKAVNNGVKRGYKEGYLRKSMVLSPFNRKNTKDNTPAVIHTEIVPGNKIRIIFMAKGGGCENVSVAKVLKPSEGTAGVEKFVLDTVEAAGGAPCPPMIVGVGIGGTLDKAMLLAKEALLRNIGRSNKDQSIRKFENRLLKRINGLGIGPGGLGGKVTALKVNIETYPCHIASMPVGVNIDCHAHRVKETVI